MRTPLGVGATQSAAHTHTHTNTKPPTSDTTPKFIDPAGDEGSSNTHTKGCIGIFLKF